MKKILILHTGGTIAMSQNNDGAVVPNSNNPLDAFQNPFHGKLDLITEDLFNLPSPHIGPKEMLLIQQRIMQAVADGIDGIVVTHGTDTLEETAYFLDLTVPNDLPVVITGAMRSANEIGSDGLHNFQTAIQTAASDQAKGKGVLVVMNDEIHTARYVTKTHTTNVATFRTPTFGPIGLVTKNGAHFFEKLLLQSCHPIDHVIKHVYLIKAYAGMDPELLGMLANSATNGVVIEALGAGNLPPTVLPELKKILDRKIPVVLVSRCFNGIAQDVYGYDGGGIQLNNLGVTFCHGLNGQKARIKLLVGLSYGLKGKSLTDFVSDAVS
ncbi:MAG: asparaginase [Liquorilactobacillus nagelii]|jgi:L-asparaginase|uniref:asparaginase n=1 Tax=Liquorilactobacillus nagelii TaxID=82688 RepID=A0A3S6QX28_9LACO|nr:asparaginase [Liquorilactobacillus nagelii]AUJ32614.1 L-asparaginase [Liquorilactobacillus nagelii]KRL42427.1 L-asparaginase [Liquorilactobacillus nagelii DSM 13675]MCC7616771.1 asparaginase [Liquorilactobacillus nagelii]MCI1634203.1 asparaginase [Liquorilactobacillus nagelii]MCI1699904.1 asparaginase [Liquorilactobacillus nagelii]